MNMFYTCLYIFTLILAFVLFLLQRFERRNNEDLSEKLNIAQKAAEYYRQRFELDEDLLLDPGFKYVGSCGTCSKRELNGEPCEIMLLFDNVKKNNYCSNFKR